MMTGTGCGKIILFGEHAVVYGRPALAVPLVQLRARARVESCAEPGIVIHARALGRVVILREAAENDPLAAIVRLTLKHLAVTANLQITLESDIPNASGLGSGAAISTAIVRALAAYFGKNLVPAVVSALVYETEKIYHGTPSGIDNSVIAYEQPVRFRRNAAGENEIASFQIARPFSLVIANTGISSPTKNAVGDVRRGWEQDPGRYERTFDTIGEIVTAAQYALARGENEQLGQLMSRNQLELDKLGVSSREIENLIEAGMRAGALGGKLSGGGRGGNVIFYLREESREPATRALIEAGAANVIVTRVRENS